HRKKLMPMLCAEQSLRARAMLRLSREDLARAARVAFATIADFETGRRQPQPRTLDAMQIALEAAGVDFIPKNGGGPGVRLRKAAE
ncbi:helix-turn-helix domain-containing protein, partial [Falsiroseomonas sp. HC035]|uniref:helix-turn-helix domain-containing protein n=1 Tax=Falsiroseomonas sp. HC035 TaxID=3390999 RepID=UPI003D3164EE